MYEWKNLPVNMRVRANASRCMHGVANMHDWPHFKLHLLTPICYINRLFNPVKRCNKAAITLCVNTSSYGVQLTRSWPTKEKKSLTQPHVLYAAREWNTHHGYHLSLRRHSITCVLICECCAVTAVSVWSINLKFMGQIPITYSSPRTGIACPRPRGVTSAVHLCRAIVKSQDKGEYIKDSGNVYIFVSHPENYWTIVSLIRLD